MVWQSCRVTSEGDEPPTLIRPTVTIGEVDVVDETGGRVYGLLRFGWVVAGERQELDVLLTPAAFRAVATHMLRQFPHAASPSG